MDTNKILIIGATGQLGYDIKKELISNGFNVIGVGSADLDITNYEKVDSFISTNNISYVVNCAAYTKVDDAETNKDLNYKINVTGTKNIVDACKKYDLPLMFFSTDYVFGNDNDLPHKEDDEKNPLCEYAKSKLEAENIVQTLNKYYILRISWVFGINGKNFVKTMIDLSKTKSELRIVSDQIGSPTYTVDVAKIIPDFVKEKKWGIYHVTNEGYVSWADFAREIFKKINKEVTVTNISTEEFNAKALRPKNSRLDKSKLMNCGFRTLPTWQDALDRYLLELNEK